MSCAIQCANGCRRWALTFPRDLLSQFKPARCHRSTCRAGPRAGRPGRGQDVLPHRAHPALRRCRRASRRPASVPSPSPIARRARSRAGCRQALGDRADDMTAGTIHSLCVILLREHGERIGVPRGFGIADESYQVQLLRRLGVYKWATSRLNDFSRHRLAGAELHPNSVQLLAELQGMARPAEPPRLRRPRAAGRRAAEAPGREGRRGATVGCRARR